MRALKSVGQGAMLLAFAITAVAASPLAAQSPEPVTTPGNGAYPALYEQVAGLPNHVVYRPRNMDALGTQKLPIYVFGNGGCSADGTSSRNHLLQIASHGYLAIAPGTIPVPGKKADEPAQGTPGQLTLATPADALSTAIDWAVRENERAGSPFYHRLATDKIAASGWSCGGLQAIVTAQEPRVKTAVIMNSGVFNGASPIPGLNATKAMVDTLRGSALYILGGPDDMAYPNGTDDFRRITTLPAVLVNIPVGHGGTYMEPNGGLAAQVVTAWLDWKLKGDTVAAKQFEGGACGFCKDSRLTIERKNIR